MTGTAGSFNAPSTPDTIKKVETLNFTLGGAANSITFDTLEDQTSLTVFARGAYDAQVEITGKDKAGAALVLGLQTAVANGTISVNFKEYMLAGDQHVIIDSIKVTLWDSFVGAADGAVSAGAAVTDATVTGIPFTVNFNNA